MIPLRMRNSFLGLRPIGDSPSRHASRLIAPLGFPAYCDESLLFSDEANEKTDLG